MRQASARTGLVVAALAVAAAVVVTFAGAAQKPVSRTQYAALLRSGEAKVGKVERAAQLGLARKAARPEMKRLILAWAAGEKAFGESLQAVRPPADAASANAELARGELAYAGDLTDAAGKLPSNASAIAGKLGKLLSASTGEQTIQRALTKLRVAGYY